MSSGYVYQPIVTAGGIRGAYQTLSLLNGVTAEDPGAIPRYYLDQNNVVHIMGRVSLDTSTTSLGLVLGNVAIGFRPLVNKYFIVAATNSTGNTVNAGYVIVEPTGDLRLFGQTFTQTMAWVALDTIYYELDN